MKIILITIAMIGLILTIVPSILVFTNTIEITTHKNIMLVGTILWFITAPLWMGKKDAKG